ncbi:MAG: HNH endonuclease [Chloroflexota bacterium]
MSDILLLNASYEPLTTVSIRRAVALMLRGRVEAVTEETFKIQGVVENFQIPTVIRLRQYINVPRRGAGWSRRGVLGRDGYCCIYCGIHPGEAGNGRVMRKQDFTIDHLLPRSRGGKNTWGNTACACFACNQRKGGRTPHEAGMALKWEPKMPRATYIVASGNVPSEWKVYLNIR